MSGSYQTSILRKVQKMVEDTLKRWNPFTGDSPITVPREALPPAENSPYASSGSQYDARKFYGRPIQDIAPSQGFGYVWDTATSQFILGPASGDNGSGTGFRAQLAATTLTATASTVVPMATESYDIGNRYNPATYQWNPPAGPVVFMYRVRLDTASVDITVEIRKNGAVMFSRTGGRYSYLGSGWVEAVAMDNANGADVYDLRVSGDGVASMLPGDTFWSGISAGGSGGSTNTPTEDIQDMLSTFLVQGANMALTYNDVANTLTIALALANGTITEAQLAFAVATQAEMDAHTGLTTAAHGGIVASTDTRLTDARVPMGNAGGVLSGTYPSPGFAVDMATQGELDTHAGTMAAGPSTAGHMSGADKAKVDTIEATPGVNTVFAGRATPGTLTAPTFRALVAADLPTDAAYTAAALTAGSIPFADSTGKLAQDNTNLFWDATAGKLGIGIIAPIAKFHVLHSLIGTYTTHRALQLSSDAGDSSGVSNSSEITGVYAIARIHGPNTSNNTNAFGLSALVADARTIAGATGTISNVHGLLVPAIQNVGNTILSAAYGVRVNAATNTGTGSITRLAGMAVNQQTVGTNNTNLLLGTVTAPTGNYNIYSSSAYQNYIAGNLGLGVTVPTEKLDVGGTVKATGFIGVKRAFSWGLPGTVVVGTAAALEQIVDIAVTALAVRIYARTAPSGGTLDIDILRSTDGGGSFTSIFSTRPTVAAAAKFGGSGAVFSTTQFNADDILRCDVIGANGAANVNVQLRMETR